MRYTALAIALISSPIAAQTTASPPAFEFRGLTTAPMSAIERRKTFRECTDRPTYVACKTGDIEVAGIRAFPLEAFFNKDDTLAELHVTVMSGFDTTLLSALTQKYGTPCEKRTDEVQNKFGAKFARRVERWCFADGYAIFKSPGRRADEASFSFYGKEDAPPPAKVDF